MKMIRDIEAALKYAELQLMLSTNDTKTRCFKTIISALRAELEREKNEPMTIDELSEMGGKPYWHVSLDGNGSYWNILDGWVATIPNDYHYGERWLAYRYEPKGEPPCLK